MKKIISIAVIIITCLSFIFVTVLGASSINRQYLYQKDSEGNYQIKNDRMITMVNYPESICKESWVPISNACSQVVTAGNEENVNITGEVYFYSEVEENHILDVNGNNAGIVTIESEQDFISENVDVEISKGVSCEEELSSIEKYSTVKTYGKKDGVSFDSSTFNVVYEITYYNVKIITETEPIILKMKVHVKAGNVETYAFQMNTSTVEGSVSEFNPSFRVINRSSKIVTKPEDTSENKQVYVVKNYGTLYTVDSEITEEEMVINSPNENVRNVQCTAGNLEKWKYAIDNDSYYFAITFKSVDYYLDMLDMKHTVRAYAITEDGEYVLGKNICATSIYNIAKLLYDNVSMSTYEAHTYLYDNILNIVTIKKNYISIAQSMLKALNIQNKTDIEYHLVNNTYKDLYHYVRLDYMYAYDKYSQRGLFSPKTKTVYNNETYITEDFLLEKLNNASNSNYQTVADWIYSETEKYGYRGFYKKKHFDNGNVLVSIDSER